MGIITEREPSQSVTTAVMLFWNMLIPIRADFHHTISTVVTTTPPIRQLRFQLHQLSTVFIWLTATIWQRTCSSTDNKISRAQFGTTEISTTVCSEILILSTQCSPISLKIAFYRQYPSRIFLLWRLFCTYWSLITYESYFLSHKFLLWFFLPLPERPSAKIAHSQLCANQNSEKPFGISTYVFSKSCIMVNMIRSRPNWEPNFFSKRLDWRKFKQ